ncbi:MAG TPA: hypothetical protein PLY70_11520 [Saprospiraceae bacterium]|nr:hypothetical protein [Saprospiraceae bacterium]HPN69777.1 hypothetical protein [Saprospiraceae bacterium]
MKTLFFSKHKSKEFAFRNTEAHNIFSKLDNDVLSTAGYYYANSLHFYGVGAENNYDNLIDQNNLVNSIYQPILGYEIATFGEDIFGNQFCFLEEKFYLLNIETAELENIADSFEGFLNVIEQNVNYYAGFPITEEMREDHISMLGLGYRLCPKKPFVIGGEYSLNNLSLEKFEHNLKYNGQIAAQIVNLEDGQRISIIQK